MKERISLKFAVAKKRENNWLCWSSPEDHYQYKLQITLFNQILYTTVSVDTQNMVEKWGIKLQIFPKIQPDKEIKKHINVFLSNTEILNHISIDLGIKVTQ